MLTLRATAKLAKFLKLKPDPDPPASDAVLGDWYANLVVEDDFRMVMCINAETRYAIPIQLRGRADSEELYNQLQLRIHRAIGFTSVPDTKAVADRITQEYAGGMVVAKTASRSILGTMNDFIGLCPGYVDSAIHPFGGIDWHEVEAGLNQVPHIAVGGANGTVMLGNHLREAIANGRLP